MQKKEKEVGMWEIQEHHLDACSPRKQWFGIRLVLYGEGLNGYSGVLTIISEEIGA